MKVIKLTDQHYIVVDGSEIKEGDWYYLPRTNSVYQCKEDPTELNLERDFGVAKVTHSTQPLEDYTRADGKTIKVYVGINPLNLFEVKELIGEVDVDKKAINSWEGCDGCDTNDELFFINGYQRGYNQALEDNKKKKYTEEDLRKAIFLYTSWVTGGMPSFKVANTAEQRIEQIIQSLKPKTEWEVEFVDGKLQLK